MNTREIDLNPSVEEARERIKDGQGEVSVSTINYPASGKPESPSRSRSPWMRWRKSNDRKILHPNLSRVRGASAC